MAGTKNYMRCFLMLNIFAAAICMSWIDVLRPIPKPWKQKFNVKRHLPNGSYEGMRCLKDRHCGEYKFCDRYERVCVKCRAEEGELCRRNKMCCRGMECAGGKCRKKIELGRLGALCKKDRDCNYNFCCARENGQNVCKRMLQEGDECGVFKGGRQYFWSHQCPCNYGLKCKNVKDNRKSRHAIRQLQRTWRNGGKKVCVRHHKIS